LTNAELVAWNHGRRVRDWFLAHPDEPDWPPNPKRLPMGEPEEAAKARLGDETWDAWVSRGIWDPDRTLMD